MPQKFLFALTGMALISFIFCGCAVLALPLRAAEGLVRIIESIPPILRAIFW